MRKKAPLDAALPALMRLDGWFERQKRVLPWRDEPTLYRVWVSEIMLQQTQVATVVPYFERFLQRFPSVEALAAAPVEDVLRLWAGLGYYSRARNLHRGAQLIAQRGFPRTREGWLEIPGVGEYTAGAILSIALDLPEAILDGNVERVLSRVHRISREAGDSTYKAGLWSRSRELIAEAFASGLRPSNINQALMELGATYCSVRAPKCLLCPLRGECRAERTGEQEAFPPKKKPKQWLEVREELHCVLDGSGRVLLRKREPGEWRAGLWDLPESPPEGGELLGELETRHVVTRHKVSRLTRVWRAGWKVAEPALGGMRWVSIEDPDVAVGSALKRTLQQARERFGF